MARTLKDAYTGQKHHAARRGIPFNLTFEQWLNVWEASGKLPRRGKGRGRYCMARFGDKGAYEVGNVHIITHEQNSTEYATSPKHKGDVVAANVKRKGEVRSPEARRNMSAAATARWARGRS